MALPEVNQTIRDPGLGTITPSAGKVQVKAGVCSKAVPNILQGFGSPAAAKDALGSGPLLDAVIQALDVAKGKVLALPLLPSSQGSVTGSFTETGVGTGTVTGSKGPEQIIKVKVGTGGALGTATFQVAIGAGAYGALVTTGTPGPWTYQVPGAYFDSLVFAAGTYVTGDVYTLNLDGTVTRVGTGTATLLDGSTHSPVDTYEPWIKITTSGALGAGAFSYSLESRHPDPKFVDGGKVYSASIAIPSGGKYVIPGSGIVLTFAGTFTAGDVYKGSATGPGYTTTEMNTGVTALLADPTEWGWIHLVGQAANAAGAATMAAALDAQMTAAETAFRYVWGGVECPTTESDATVKSAFASFQSARVDVFAGDADVFSRLTGRTDRRSCAWAVTARLGALKLSKDPSAVNLGRVANVSYIWRDEAATPGLDEARFTTMRTFVGLPGYYVTNFRMMAAPGSDFTYGMGRRVMDRACTITRQGYLYYLNDDVRIDKDTGLIDERDAQSIDAQVTAKLEAALLDEQEASSVNAVISRTDNLLSSSTANAEVSVIPKAYLKAINVTIGFANPALKAA